MPCVHSVGAPLAPGQNDVRWPCNKEHKYIVHFPETREIWSYGSGYGGNALLGKKCFALRIASVMGRDQGWLAEHMLILGRDVARGREDLRDGGVSERVRQDQLRDADSAAGLRRAGRSRRSATTSRGSSRTRRPVLRDQSGGGIFRRRAGNIGESNPNAMAMLRENVIFTNVALTDDGDVWWEGMTRGRQRS